MRELEARKQVCLGAQRQTAASLVMNAVINICMPLISHYVIEGRAMPPVVGGEEGEAELARGPGWSFHAGVCEEALALGGGRWPLSRCYSWCQLAGPDRQPSVS